MLARLGVTKQAQTVYRMMLAEPGWAVRDIARHLGYPERTIRKTLDQLADLSLLAPSDMDMPRPVPPDVGLARLLQRAEEEMRQRQQEIAAARQAISTLAAEYHNAFRDGVAGVRLSDAAAVRIRLAEVAQQATKECWSFSPGGAHRPDAMRASKPLNQQALERGVQLRCVYQDAFRADPATAVYADWLTTLGGQVRTVPSVPMQLVIVDRRVALLPANPGDARAGAIEVHNLGVLAALAALFEQVWAAAVPLGSMPSRDVHGLSPQEEEVLRLLADGMTDEAVARKLGLSVRTHRRIVADLAERLGAASRFQVGVQAVRSGWL